MSIQELEKELNGGSRENRYRLTISLPTGVTGDVRSLSVLATSTGVPGKTRGRIEIKRLGITRRLAGDTVTEEAFECEFQVPKNGSKVYKPMNDWYMLPQTSTNYKAKMKMEQLDIQNNVSATWNYDGVWVGDLPKIDFNSENNDKITTFAVTFVLDDVNPV